MKESLDKIFLYDESIPPMSGPYATGILGAKSTICLEDCGFSWFAEEQIGDYDVVASASVILADIEHYDYDLKRTAEQNGRRVLFSGGITIHKYSQILGTDFHSRNFVLNGRIYTDRICEERFFSKDGLKHVVFDFMNNPIPRIEAIIEGYIHQRDQETLKSRFQ